MFGVLEPQKNWHWHSNFETWSILRTMKYESQSSPYGVNRFTVKAAINYDLQSAALPLKNGVARTRRIESQNVDLRQWKRTFRIRTSIRFQRTTTTRVQKLVLGLPPCTKRKYKIVFNHILNEITNTATMTYFCKWIVFIWMIREKRTSFFCVIEVNQKSRHINDITKRCAYF